MITNADITVYNRKYDPVSREYKWLRTVILGVSSYVNENASSVNDAARSENSAVFRVPEDCEAFKSYLTPYEYEYATHPEGFWTFATGDLIVLGVCPVQEITGEATLARNHIKVFRISSASDNRRGTLPHVRARCE